MEGNAQTLQDPFEPSLVTTHETMHVKLKTPLL